MKTLLTLLLLASLTASGQTNRAADRRSIYSLVIRELADRNVPVVNEPLARIYPYDIDGDYERWFYGRFREGIVFCVVPIQYESTVTGFLQSRGIVLDTGSAYAQLERFQPDSLSSYLPAGQVISYTRAPLRSSALGNLFKERNATALSHIVFDPLNEVAFLKLQVFARKKQVRYNPSRMVVLQIREGQWGIIGVLEQKRS